jgi:hypothetical protein
VPRAHHRSPLREKIARRFCSAKQKIASYAAKTAELHARIGMLRWRFPVAAKNAAASAGAIVGVGGSPAPPGS